MTTESTKIKSPSRIVWRTQMSKGLHMPHRVSKITCIVNHLLSPLVSQQLIKLGVQAVYVESGRNVRKVAGKRSFGLGDTVRFEDSSAEIFRFTVPRDNSQMVVESLVKAVGLNIPGRGSIYAQDLIEFSNVEPVRIADYNINDDSRAIADELNLLRDLAQITCVLSIPGSANKLSKLALELGLCVPLITNGSATDIRDQLGLIRITLPPEKELVQLLLPEQDSANISRLLIEAAGLSKPGRGFIYRTPVSAGLIDTRMRIGQQENAASIEQIIAAIDQLKNSTAWRKRFSPVDEDVNQTKQLMPEDHCEVTAICIEDRLEEMMDAAITAGATGATSSRVKRLIVRDDDKGSAAQVHCTFSVPGDITDQVVDALLNASTMGDNLGDRIQVLDSPAAYVQNW